MLIVGRPWASAGQVGFMDKNICYLCGEPGADTKDHVPPKGFLESGNYAGASRITLPAHKECNQRYSADEEYTRDLLGPAAEYLGLRGVDCVLERTNQSRKRPAGYNRRQAFLKYVKTMEVRSPSGLYLGRALGVPYDRDRVDRVGAKIARGIIYSDSYAYILDKDVICYGIPLQEVKEERERELKKENPFWVRLGWSCCQHDMFGDSVAVRRVYFGHPTVPTVTIECAMAVMLISTFFIVCATFPLPANGRPSFSFSVDTSTGAWVKKIHRRAARPMS
jgi:hypothetical protein